ncbi:hypothetical protein [Streptomyces sp. NPDC094032]|uniref:hypothetical protein n=1 Tax=Streptomyces sp. NPDC094032 TaxID=3155308 RepID=UPI00332CB0AF
MRVRMRVQISGTRDGAEWPERGGTIDLPDDEAEQLIRYGAAEADEPAPDDAPPTDTGETDPDVETAAAPDSTEKRPGRSRTAKG